MGMRRYIRKLGERGRWFLFFEDHEFEGLRLRIHEEANEGCLIQVTEALKLINEVDPQKYASIARLLPGGIAIIEPACHCAHYDPVRKACCLSWDFIQAHDIESIALIIVHELCHARLMSHGIGYEEPIRLRVKKVILRRELAFAKRLEHQCVGQYDYVSEVLERIDTLSTAAYTDPMFRRDYRQDELRKLRQVKALGTPKWLRRVAVASLRQRWRRENAQTR